MVIKTSIIEPSDNPPTSFPAQERNSKKVVKLCKNWKPPKQPPVAARMVRETPTKTRAAAPKPSQPSQRARYYDPATPSCQDVTDQHTETNKFTTNA
jgi:hypothetical protein